MFLLILKKLPHGDVAAKAKVRIAKIRPLVHVPSTTKEAFAKIIKVAARSKEKSSVASGKELTLRNINYTVGVDSIRVVTHTSSPVAFSQGRLSKPERVYINFNNTRLDNSVTRDIKIGSRFLKGLRLSQFDEKNSRLVFDLNKINNLKIGVWQEGSELLVELSDKKPQIKKVVSKSLAPATHKNVKAVKKTKDNRAIKKPVIKVSKKRAITKNNKKVRPVRLHRIHSNPAG